MMLKRSSEGSVETWPCLSKIHAIVLYKSAKRGAGLLTLLLCVLCLPETAGYLLCDILCADVANTKGEVDQCSLRDSSYL